ncbi:MAG: Hsp33 family molecular chaperone HslO [Acidobacteria bacterium]|nr:MAG: Hsp33 family molecular chaperone HslO [Acidobacteriota bacterium]
MPADQLIHATAADNQIRCMAAVTTNLVAEACRRHRTFPTASAALGRTLTGGLLLGSGVKDLEKLTVHFDCDGPIGDIVAQADAHGNVRGYVANPQADATAMNQHGKLDVRAVVGGGQLYITRDAGFEIGLMKEPYRGTVPIVSGEIGEDIAYYLAKSEQINSAVSLGVLMVVDAADGRRSETESTAQFPIDSLRVAAAGGFIVQMMPGAEDGLAAHLERNISQAPYATDMICDGLTPLGMLRAVLGDLDLAVLEEKEPRFLCQCSHERALLIIGALGREEVEDMLKQDNGAELICHFCNEAYQISDVELKDLLTRD